MTLTIENFDFYGNHARFFVKNVNFYWTFKTNWSAYSKVFFNVIELVEHQQFTTLTPIDPIRLSLICYEFTQPRAHKYALSLKRTHQ